MLRTLPLLLVAASLAVAQEPKEKAKAQAKPKQKPAAEQLPPAAADYKYGPHERNVFDFWKAPADKPTPLFVFIHGGGWNGGDKSGTNVNTIKAYLDAGVSVAAINYRFIAQAMEEKVEPPVKAPLHDAARAIQTLRSKAKEWNIDPTRVAASGGSAGACTSLWLAFHDDLADPKSADPVARESTRLTCAAVTGAQTSLDPKQVKEWMPNARYGGHAFGFRGQQPSEFEAALAGREKVLPWIREYSPFELVTKDDPPVFLEYAVQETPPETGKDQKDPTHSAIYGLELEKKAKEAGVECVVLVKESGAERAKASREFVLAKLKAK